MEQTTKFRLDKWNWGAFFLTWIWGLGNGTYIALLALLPIVNVVMPFYLGFKGTELAYENGDWYNDKHFDDLQKKWAIAGFITFAAAIAISGILVGTAINEDKKKEQTKDTIIEYLIEDGIYDELNLENSTIVVFGLTSLGTSSGEQYISYTLTALINADHYLITAYYNSQNQFNQIDIKQENDLIKSFTIE